MPRKTRLHYTDEMKSYIWDRYKTGDSVWSIARWRNVYFSTISDS